DAVWTAVMVTPGNTPPVLSVTVPVSTASCARAIAGIAINVQRINIRVSTRRLFTSRSVCKWWLRDDVSCLRDRDHESPIARRDGGAESKARSKREIALFVQCFR